MLSKKMEAAINHQINLEIHSALQYLQMSAYFSSANLNGFAHWMRVQYQEELVHANKLFDYVIARDGDVTLEAVAALPKAWKSTLAALQAGYQAEVNNTKQINALMDSAIKENDHATRVILEWFIEEQVEEERGQVTSKTPGGSRNHSGEHECNQVLGHRIARDGLGGWFGAQVFPGEAVAGGVTSAIVVGIGAVVAGWPVAFAGLGGAAIGLGATALIAGARGRLDGDGFGASVEITMTATLAVVAVLVR